MKRRTLSSVVVPLISLHLRSARSKSSYYMRFQLPIITTARKIVCVAFCLTSVVVHASSMSNSQDVEIANGGENALVIMMHGLGDTPVGWSQMARNFKPSLPHVKWILPCAPENPVSVNGGMKMTSWMDILEIPIAVSSPDNGKDIESSIGIVNKIVDAELAKGDIKPERIVIGGFSQGGALAIASSLRLKKKIGGFFSLSGWCLPRQNIQELAKTSVNNNVPVFIGHGTADNVVLYENAEQSKKYFEGAKFKDITFKAYANMGHSSCPEETNDLLRWLSKVLA